MHAIWLHAFTFDPVCDQAWSAQGGSEVHVRHAPGLAVLTKPPSNGGRWSCERCAAVRRWCIANEYNGCPCRTQHVGKCFVVRRKRRHVEAFAVDCIVQANPDKNQVGLDAFE